jgi:hypothetical protein
LIYIFLDNKTEKSFQEFLVTFEERAEILEKLEYDAVELSRGAATIGPEAMSNTNAAIPTTLTDKALEFIVL